MSLLLNPVQYALNKALSQDPETQQKLTEFHGKSIAVTIDDLQQHIHILFEQQQLILSGDSTPADLDIKAKSFDLLKLLQHPDNLFSAEIHIHGDVQFAKRLQDVVAQFDFDWEQQIADITGDTIGAPLVYHIKQSAQWIRNTHSSLTMNTSEYLREEIQLPPHQIQVDDYMSAIDKLTADVDRLAARVQRLSKPTQR